jgi:tight adherence protein C
VSAGAPLIAAVLLLFAAALVELARAAPGDLQLLARRALAVPVPGTRRSLGELASALGLSDRMARAGVAERTSVATVLAGKVAAAVLGALAAAMVAPAAPGRLAPALAIALPVAGFLAPDAWLERRARERLRDLRSALPDALDLVAVGAAAGRPPLAGLAEVSRGDGALAEELSILLAEADCGVPQREVLDGLRLRAPVPEVAALCSLIERSRRYGSPLSDQLRGQATGLRGAQRRRVEERAARAAPKIQLTVALLLVPSVLLIIAAGLLSNVDRFLAGL